MMKNSRFTPSTVSRFFIFDWQFGVDIYNAAILRFISLAILILPFIIDSQKSQLLVLPSGLVLSSLTFLGSCAFYFFFCPRFIREYRDFGQYQSRKHSHRWIVWEFYNYLKTFEGRGNIVRETVSKRLSIKVSQLKQGEIKTVIENCFNEGEKEDTITIDSRPVKIKVFRPINLNRDIYLPFYIDNQKMFLSLEEDDKKLFEKEKELFWILYTQAVKERLLARLIFWVLIYTTIFTFFATLYSTFSKVTLS